MQRGGCVYMMANHTNSTIYIGVSSNLIKRVQEHKSKTYEHGFTSKYNCTKLVYYQFSLLLSKQ
ncbi:GIY-YIG nuclease family protein [Parasediminibacterium sp. JCM 36343]|uniref:GIY-YIG nuclease family protein n=1 Tax=Parasediminibacterium sp. JCM 36343 TaxID=3374279 RepID=UPI00397E0681